MVANYHLVLITLDRVVSIKAPVLYRSRLELDAFKFGWLKVSIIGTLVMFLLSILSLFSLEANDEYGLCRQELTELYTLINIIITTSNGTLIPLIVILVSNVFFTVALLARRVLKTGAPVTAEKEQKELKKAQIERNYVKMLFAMTSSLLLLNLATVGLSAAAPVAQTRKQQVLIEAFLSLPLTFIHCSNILFYFISTPMFRKALKKALKKMFTFGEEKQRATGNGEQ